MSKARVIVRTAEGIVKEFEHYLNSHTAEEIIKEIHTAYGHFKSIDKIVHIFDHNGQRHEKHVY